MGTTLTGTTPQDTYDSLIKVTDNGPLSATAKYLSDGLGNDSVLALSTSQVGVGTASPAAPLNVNGSSGADFLLSRTSGATSGVLGTIRFGNQNVDSNMSAISAEQDGANNAANLIFSTQATGGATAERMRITSAGNVGIGLSNPIQKLGVSDGSNAFYVTHDANGPYIQAVNNANTVYKRQTYDAVDHVFLISASERARFTTNGLTFNGDTVAANALDDYEEGTWTMGVSFGGASVGVTTSSNTGTYTKIGRKVTVNGFLVLTSKGSSTGSAAMTGLPFSVGASNPFYSAPSFRLFAITYTGTLQGYGGTGGTTILLESISEAGTLSDITNSNIADNSAIMISFTYFV